ncbi:MAG: efflux RND transporter periplasmic adaptor subunit [Verrucomicrobiae bacterium]|nr:efflux RND transporter periplasmic adaptor subunit [Verrucomicrobiae bacterium]
MKSIKKTWIGIGAGVLAVLFLACLARMGLSPASKWETADVRRGDVKMTVRATATIKPEHRLEIKPPLAGRAESVEVDMGAKVRQGQILAWMSSSERAALLDAARARGEKEYNAWKDIYRAAPLVAPLDGTIISKSLVPGQVVQSTETVFVMSDRLIAQVDVDETDLGKVRVEQAVEVSLDGFPGVRLKGRVNKVAYDSVTVNNVTTYKVDVLLETIPDFLRSGMTANVVFFVAERIDVLLIPASSVQADGSVLAVGKGGKPQSRSVQTGITDGRWIEVVSGLSEGEQVVQNAYHLPASASGGGFSLLPRMPSRKGNPPPR